MHFETMTDGELAIWLRGFRDELNDYKKLRQAYFDGVTEAANRLDAYQAAKGAEAAAQGDADDLSGTGEHLGG